MRKNLLLLLFCLPGSISSVQAQFTNDTTLYLVSTTGGCDTLTFKSKQVLEFSWSIGEPVIGFQEPDAQLRVSEGFFQDWPELFSIPSDKPEQPSLGMTPNGDGKNDFFMPVQDILYKYPDNELFVFNRWGVLVYQVQPYDNSWSGLNFQGRELPEGTYYYLLRLGNQFNSQLQGSITIKR